MTAPGTQTTRTGLHGGKRLSPLRVMLAFVIILAVAAGAFLGFHAFDSAKAESASPWFAGYVDVTATPSYPFETPASTAGRDVVLSFVVASDDDPCAPSWGDAYSLDDASHELDLDRKLARLRQGGGDAIVSFGGQRNDELSTACADPAALLAAYTSVVDRYQLTTIDLDVEGASLSDAAAGLRRAEAVSALQSSKRKAGGDLAVWLTLPVAPSGMTKDATDAIAQMLTAGVDLAGVNVMTMDYGSSLDGKTMAQGSIDALNATHRQLAKLYSNADISLSDQTIWSKMGATPMVGQNDVRNEVFGIADAQKLSAFAQDKKLGRMSLWSLNRDATCGPNYVDLTHVSDACSGIDQGDASFAGILSTGFAGRPHLSAPAVTTSEAVEPIVDDPATSPYPIWAKTSAYLEGTKIVWHGNVYSAKWWTRGDLPDNPVLNEWETPWTLIGPVLPGEKPYAPPTLPAGTYPDWSGTVQYDTGDRVLFEGTPYESKWWNQGASPDAASSDPDGSPWVQLTADEVAAVLKGATAAG
ncbi:chitinase [Compostimonas suwonensis]|uniref:Chitinase n=1 Tax=Compostimonas suwonensis TaxID=1048394 RepID=A0A2M9BWW7_9MICO|nr:chitinase [Compostimonas suwonensis]PJJ62420.1 chitinase [Compostimonas suwonensis]